MRRSPKRRRIARRVDFLPRLEVVENRVLLSVVPRGTATIVNTVTTGTQDSPAVAMDANGDSIVVWSDQSTYVSPNYEADIKAQRYNASGVPVKQDGTANGGALSNFIVDAGTGTKDFTRNNPAVAMDPNGDFVVAWELDDSTNYPGPQTYQIQARVFNAQGTALTGDISVTGKDHDLRNQPSVTMDSSGNWVIAWSDQGTGAVANNDIFAKKYSLTGTQIALNGSTSALQVNTGAAATGNQFDASVSDDPAGAFVVAWTTFDPTNPNLGSQSRAQRFNSSGVPQGSVIDVNTTIPSKNSQGLVGSQGGARVAVAPAGDFIIAWESDLNDNSTTRGDISYKRYNADGSLRNNPSNVDLTANASTAGFQNRPSVAIDANGNATISWDSNDSNQGLFLRRINAQGLPIEGSDVPIGALGPQQGSTAVAVDSQGDVAVAYQQGTNNYDIFSQFFKYENDAPTLTKPGNDTLPENSGQLTVNLAGITAGGPAGASNPESQTLAVTVFSNNTGLIPTPLVNYTSPNSTGTLTFTPVAGQFGTATITVTVTDNGGTANGGVNSTQQQFTVTVNAVNSAPVVTTNPTNQTVNAGQTATFTAAASGTPAPTVQWQMSTNGGATFANIAGATSTTYTTPATTAADNGDEFRAVFTNSVGSATTTAATLTVDSAPVVTTNPVSETVNAGQTATFTAAASGNPAPAVQWQVSTNGGSTFTNIAAATSPTLSFTTTAGQNGNEYRAVFTNSVGSATTTAATLTVDTAPVVTTNPLSETVNAGQTATFTAAASGNPAPAVQWQVSTNGGSTFTNIAAATSPTLSFTTTAGQNLNEYRAVFTNSAGSATTTAATLTVIATAAPVVTTNPSDETVNAGQTATFTAAASGTPAPTVQWQMSTNGGATFANIAGATSTTYTTPATAAADNGDEFRAVFTNSVGSATTTAATLTVVSAPTANSQSVAVAHDTATAVTLTGSDPNNPQRGLTYIVLTSPAHGTLSGTAPNLTYTPNSGYQGADSFTFKDNNGFSDSNSATVTLTVAAATPTANSQTFAVAHDTAKAITLTGTDGNDNPALPLTFSVATGPSHGTLSGLNAATGAVTYTPAAGFHGSDSFTFTTSNGQHISSAATVTLNVAVGTPTANPQSVNVAHDGAGTPITLTASDGDAPALPLTFALVVGQGPSHGTLIGFNAATGAVTYTPAAGFHGTDSFQFTASNGTNVSGAATVTLTVATGTPTANAQSVSTNQDTPLGITLTGSDDDVPALPLTFATVTGQGPAHGTISGFNASTGALTYAPNAGFTGSDSFQFTVSNGTNVSAAATVTINVNSTQSGPTITTNPVSETVNAGQTATFTAAASGNPAPTVQWQVSTDGGSTFANITSATSPTLSFTTTVGQNGNEYRAVFTNSVGSATTTAATLTVNTAPAAPVVTTNPANQAVSAGQTATFTAAATGSPTPTVQWQVSTDGGSTFANIVGATSTTLSFTAGTGESGNEYRAVFTNASGSATTTAATLTVSQATIASTVGVAWGTAGTATLQTNADGLRLLPAGRNTDMPWLGINRITITLSTPELLTAGDVSVHGVNVANYGPVTISGSGTTYTITLGQPINAADRVTVTIGNDTIATFTRRLDVLPGDVNDDGMVNSQDAVIVRNEYLAFAPVTIPMMFLDVNGDGVVDATDYGLVHNRAATHLP